MGRVLASVPAGIYPVIIKAVQTSPKKRLLFLDLLIEGGPLTGTVAQVGVHVPKRGDRNALFHFRRKIAGLGDLSAAFDAMSAADPDGSNLAGALEVFADALTGRRVIAEIGITDEDDSAGTNELRATHALEPMVSDPRRGGISRTEAVHRYPLSYSQLRTLEGKGLLQGIRHGREVLLNPRQIEAVLKSRGLTRA